IKQSFDYYVGIDRGSLLLYQNDLPVDLAVGDFDSLKESEHKQIVSIAKELLTAPAEKDDTDTQLALAAVLEKFPHATVTLIGATGGRIDHFLANLWMAVETRFRPFCQNIVIKDKQNTISFLLPGKHMIKKENDKQYLSYCCLSVVYGLTLSKSKYTLDNQDVLQPTVYASNQFIEDFAEVEFKTGVIAVVQSKDQ